MVFGIDLEMGYYGVVENVISGKRWFFSLVSLVYPFGREVEGALVFRCDYPMAITFPPRIFGDEVCVRCGRVCVFRKGAAVCLHAAHTQCPVLICENRHFPHGRLHLGWFHRRP